MSTDRKYYEHFEKSEINDSPMLARVYCCPCCGYPTLSEPGDYEICRICSWEDDFITYGDKISGANGDYSLEEAQQNFKKYLTMYRANVECDPQLKQHGYKYLHDFVLRPQTLENKKRLVAVLNRYIAESDFYQRGEIWKEYQSVPTF